MSKKFIDTIHIGSPSHVHGPSSQSRRASHGLPCYATQVGTDKRNNNTRENKTLLQPLNYENLTEKWRQ
ncbi:hypothetical protein E2C01_058825 [Portunus trituberculatus]|uniref:Uncharacterized protein n=1 Tax=Portunus trituberculatus TaxID=210409 RepID=A0A5B7H475_PORTR|nr:hypothetical protein [Portunus trituberculatus]